MPIGQLIPLEIPPGVVKQGTKYQSRGRWFDADLVRWSEGAMLPVGGWEHAQEGSPPSDVNVDGVPRGMMAWVDNSRAGYLWIGTHTKLYVLTGGTLADITPVGFTTGSSDATLTSGQYDKGNYGQFAYGEGSPVQETLEEADSWIMDNFGEIPVGVFTADGKLYEWDLNTGNAATEINGDASLPVSNKALVVTPERFLVALGADGDGRLVKWSDQEDRETWVESSSNQAGSFPLSSQSDILNGKAARNETLIWTGEDLWSMRYIAGDLIYSFKRVGNQCGAISRRAMAMVDSKAVWMGHRNFFLYDGFVQPIPSDVSDFVFSNMNRVQASKIFAVPVSEFREVWWFYPSSGSEIDRYVAWNYDEDFWMIGELERTAGVGRSVFGNPFMADASGNVYKHEQEGGSHDDPSDTALTPEAESGPIEIADGDRVMDVEQVVPDEKTQGDVQIKLHSALFPNASETEHGPFTPANPTDVRITARQVRLEVEQVNDDWRLGTIRLRVKQGSQR